MNFLHTYMPQAVALRIGDLTIYWYGIIMAVAIMLGLALALVIAKKRDFKTDDILDASIWAIIGGLLGARVYEIFLEWPFYSSHPQQIIQVWNGGLAIHGALIGALFALLIFVRKKSYNIWSLSAIMLPGVALAQAIGRVGNYFNQELFGLPTKLPWGIPIDILHRPLGYETFQYFHPTFLYEAKLLIILALVLYLLARKKNFSSSYIIAIYLIGYGIIRFFLEFIKIDPTPIVLGLRWPQIMSLIMIIFGLVIIKKVRSKTS